MRNQAGFSLIEVLVVVAITVLLFSLLFMPMIASFNMTGEARTKVAAQDAARQNLARITREISDGLYVYDNSGPIRVIAPSNPPGNWGPQIPLANAKIDIMMPRMLMHCNNQDHPEGVTRDYARDNPGVWRDELAWPACPECQSLDIEARPIQPLTPSDTMVRYFIGLKDPSRPYVNGYEGLTTSVNDNTYVLYRAEFRPWNKNLIKRDANDESAFILNDPDFFYDTEIAENGKSYSENWREISKVVGPSKDVDLVDFTWETDHWVATSRIRFAPTAIQNDPLTPTYLSDTDAEMPEAIPTVFRASQGSWLNSPLYRVVVYRTVDDVITSYFTDIRVDSNGREELWLFKYDSPGVYSPIFNISQYRYDGSISLSEPELMLNIDELQGEVRFAFPAEDQFRTDDINPPLDGSPTAVPRLSLFSDKVRVVPGSEIVMGPDQGPVTHGASVHYTRVPLALGRIGMNQYKIDYDTGDMWFLPGVRQPLPAGETIQVSYRYHNNQPGDVVKADYTTKNLLTVVFGMKIYDHNTGKPHRMELTSKVRVRNMVR